MEKLTKKYNILSKLLAVVVCIAAIGLGYFAGNLICNNHLSVNNYASLSPNELADDISNINYKTTTPNNYPSAICFQVAEKLLQESTHYEVRGNGLIETSLGVTQTSATVDSRNGDDLYLAFTTYSSIVKASKQCHYNIGGNLKMYDGTPIDETTENVNWSDKYQEYTWEEYFETFGKYANKNCSYIVSTKTISKDSGIQKDGNLYKSTLELDTNLATISYVKQIGNNMGVNPASIVFNKLILTFYLDENWNFVKQEKFESYTIPYAGINLTLEATITTNFKIS